MKFSNFDETIDKNINRWKGRFTLVFICSLDTATAFWFKEILQLRQLYVVKVSRIFLRFLTIWNPWLARRCPGPLLWSGAEEIFKVIRSCPWCRADVLLRSVNGAGLFSSLYEIESAGWTSQFRWWSGWPLFWRISACNCFWVKVWGGWLAHADAMCDDYLLFVKKTHSFDKLRGVTVIALI